MPSTDATPSTATATPPEPTFLITSRHPTAIWLNTCDHAQTLLAFAPNLNRDVLIPLPCNQWSCTYCALRKIRKLAYLTREAKPNRLLTLTVDPQKHDTPRHAFDATRRCIPELIRALRARFGQFEYLRVTELTKRGWPHYHLLVRSPYIPHAVVKAEWQRLTGAIIVDVRQVKEHFAAYTYLVKYLTKLHKIDWTERHVSYSRHFFPADPQQPKDPLELLNKAFLSTHPTTYLCETYPGETITRHSPSVYLLPKGSKPL